MAHILSVLLALAPAQAQIATLKHVKEGQEYLAIQQREQEPGANASEIFAVLKHVRPGDDFVPNFEMFAKSDVNGKNENPIYKFLKSRCPSVRKEFQASYKLYYDPYHQDDIRWNFEKFLINERGQPVRRYDESLDPMDIVPDIDALLSTIQKGKK